MPSRLRNTRIFPAADSSVQILWRESQAHASPSSTNVGDQVVKRSPRLMGKSKAMQACLPACKVAMEDQNKMPRSCQWETFGYWKENERNCQQKSCNCPFSTCSISFGQHWHRFVALGTQALGWMVKLGPKERLLQGCCILSDTPLET